MIEMSQKKTVKIVVALGIGLCLFNLLGLIYYVYLSNFAWDCLARRETTRIMENRSHNLFILSGQLSLFLCGRSCEWKVLSDRNNSMAVFSNYARS